MGKQCRLDGVFQVGLLTMFINNSNSVQRWSILQGEQCKHRSVRLNLNLDWWERKLTNGCSTGADTVRSRILSFMPESCNTWSFFLNVFFFSGGVEGWNSQVPSDLHFHLFFAALVFSRGLLVLSFKNRHLMNPPSVLAKQTEGKLGWNIISFLVTLCEKFD